MNKLKVTLAGLFVACLSIGMVSAQANTTAAQPTAKKSSTKAKSPKAATGSTAAKSGQHLKKDGTPDKRYKENKTAKPAANGAAGAPAATSTPNTKTGGGSDK